jgi:hypothetical protein
LYYYLVAKTRHVMRDNVNSHSFMSLKYHNNGVLLSRAVEIDVIMARPTLKTRLTRRARDEEMHIEQGIIAFCEIC